MIGENAMESRIIAIELVNEKHVSNAIELASTLSTMLSGKAKLMLFKKNGIQLEQLADGINVVEFSDDADNDSKMKNFIIKWCEDQQFKGFLHIVQSDVKVNDGAEAFICSAESAMHSLDYSIYFSTVTDVCNYVFKKFCPRLTINVDDVELKDKLHLPSEISFTSHSNLCWTIYDCKQLDGNVQKYDERFSIAMYQIIEYLARRRSTKKDGQLYFMNQYLSVPEEVGAIAVVPGLDGDLDQKKMQEEDATFKSIEGLDYSPDNNLDIILDAFYKKVKEKTA